MSTIRIIIYKIVSILTVNIVIFNATFPVFARNTDTATYSIMSFDTTEKADSIAQSIEKHSPDYFIIHSQKNESLSLSSEISECYSRIPDDNIDKDSNQNIIYYKKSYEPIKSKCIWLSGTPDKKSKTNEAKDYQTCTYALFSHNETDKKIAIFASQTDDNEKAAKDQAMYLFSRFQCYRDYYPTLLSVKCKDTESLRLFDDPGLSNHLSEQSGVSIYASASVKMLSDNDGVIRFSTDKPSKQLTDSGKYIALTFDDGPTRLEGRTNKILDVIERYNVKATFFVLGERITLENPAERKLLVRERRLGCEIGNHTYNHDSYVKLKDTKSIEKQITQTDDLIEEICGASYATLLRPPGGIVNNKSDLDRPIINWSVDTLDWSSKQTVKGIIDTVIRDAGNGKVVLMHDINTKSSAALDEIIKYLLSNNYNIVTVSELMEFCDVDMWAGYIYTDANHEKRTTFCN